MQSQVAGGSQPVEKRQEQEATPILSPQQGDEIAKGGRSLASRHSEDWIAAESFHLCAAIAKLAQD